MKVSVITPTVRPDALDLITRSLQKQEFKDFEWLIGSSFNPEIAEARWIKDDFTGGKWSLNRIYNKLIKESSGEIIISLQDSIYIPSDGILKFISNLEKLGKHTLISGVGHQYARLNKYGKPELQVWADPRKTDKYGSLYECTFPDCEWNWCAFYKSAIEDVGGFDEALDFTCRGVDAFAVDERLNYLGYKFYLDQTNESLTLRHDRGSYGGEKLWNDSHGLFNGEYDKRKKELKQSGSWPILTYLTNR